MSDPAPTQRLRPEPRVERARPADRGLVARLVEVVVAEDPSVAPAVAAGSLRAAQWLQHTRPDWQGVAVVDEDDVRCVVGYVAAWSGARAPQVLVHPAHRDADLAAALVAAARSALVEEPAPPPVVVEPDPEPELVRVAPARTTWRQRVTEPAGAMAIVAAGLVAVLAVQVGTGPLADVVPFLDRDRDASAESEARADAGPAPAPSSPSSEPTPSAAVPGVVLTPAPAPAPAEPGAGAPASPPTSAPTGPATPAPSPVTPAPSSPSRPPSGPTSGLLDPAVDEVVEVLDGTTGNAAAPVTGAVRDLVDLTTDVLDDALDLLVPPHP